MTSILIKDTTREERQQIEMAQYITDGTNNMDLCRFRHRFHFELLCCCAINRRFFI